MKSARFNKLSKLIICSSLLLGASAASPALTSFSTGTVSASPAEYPLANVTIDGVLQNFEGQGAVLINGSTMVPMRAIFENLGATISWKESTKTVTAVKGSTTIVIQIGAQTATVNGKKVTLTKEAVLLSGSTLVPLRFVSEALGAKVSWDAKTYTAIIETKDQVATPPSGTQVGSITVKYGKHTYESKSQAQYDKVMEIVAKGMKDYKNKPFYNNFSESNDSEFMRGVEAGLAQTDAYTGGKLTTYYRGVHEVNQALKSMRSNGVSTDKAVEAHTIFTIGSSITKASRVDTNDKNIRSAYDSLVLGKNDCDSWANAMIAFFDSASYNTAIVANQTHADGYVQIEGNWYSINAGLQFSGKDLPSGGDLYTYTAPTY